MGCNMYLFVECRADGRWNHIPGDFYDGGKHVLFALLAGVRNNEGIEPLDDPRGLPLDVSRELHAIYHAEDAVEPHPEYHVTSWFTLSELQDKVDWERFQKDWHEYDFSLLTMGRLDAIPDVHPDDVRIVFWFDDTITELEREESRPFIYTSLRS